MTTNYNVGDEILIKARIASIYADIEGITYTVNVLTNDGENLAGCRFRYDESIIDDIVQTN